jgi:hypothetical protein
MQNNSSQIVVWDRRDRPYAAIDRLVQRCGAASPDQSFGHRAAFVGLIKKQTDLCEV